MAYRRAREPKFTILEQHQMELRVVDKIIPDPTPQWTDEFHRHVALNDVPAKLQGAVLTFETSENDYERFVGLIDIAIENASKAIEEAREQARVKAEATRTREQTLAAHQARLADKFRGK